ncbi:uncharacterized protein LOC114439910 [Parambassis ranga]|uniref:Uncharacterized protein LOC114439910 n=1 Tax=Parambassis ranga TaxID=210632 RepID=A0A6P7IRM1_9TELE|nr:uncharacterized protein LOC114439910 [Parambassis ranga]
MTPSQGLVQGTDGADVTEGYSFTFTCSISSHYPGGVFSLIYSDSNISDTKPAVNNSASFSFPVADYKHHGSYSCVYEVTLSSRKFTSNMTAVMSLSIKAPLVRFISLITAPLLLLVLLALVVVCLVHRRRRAQEIEALNKNQGQTQMNVIYAVNSEEEEQLYENFEPKSTTMRQERSKCVKEEMCENENHYRRCEEGGNEENSEHIYVTVEDIEAEEEGRFDLAAAREEATSSFRETYAHTSEVHPDDDLDIYGEEENIYQND